MHASSHPSNSSSSSGGVTLQCARVCIAGQIRLEKKKLTKLTRPSCTLRLTRHLPVFSLSYFNNAKAPMLATYSLLPILQGFLAPFGVCSFFEPCDWVRFADIDVKLRDISVAGGFAFIVHLLYGIRSNFGGLPWEAHLWTKVHSFEKLTLIPYLKISICLYLYIYIYLYMYLFRSLSS